MGRITVSIIKADVGSLAGHHVVHPKQIEVAKESLQLAVDSGIILDYYVFNCGDDLQLLMTHRRGENNPEVHKVAWNVFKEVTEKVSKPLKLYAAGQDLLVDAFSGNIRGMGPGVAELEFDERPSDPIIVFAADKTEPGAWNLPLFKIFADPFNTAGLVIDPRLHAGFKFQILDVMEGLSVELSCPEEMYDLLALIGTPSRYVISKIYRKDGLPAASASTSRLSLIAGRYVGKDDPVCIVRAQSGLPAVGEILEAFAFPHLVAGWMRGSHNGPLMPVSLDDAKCTRFDGPPRVVALGFQLRDGYLEGPADLFDDPAFEWSRRKAMEIVDYMRRHGPFMPARLGPEEMEYTTLPMVLEKLKSRFKRVS
ncbi:MAG: fructose-1,6-bisphosphatase [archaeon GB-1867-097]|nr:fructose-1,6-bisphosphatase [Candidatus Culexmicrobium thermophilum]RLE56965.1 MAG: fructose 1,6-bisphosphatase [Candidatus Verstraetearchaeota archaeon]